MDVSSLSGSCVTMPSDEPRGMMVALCSGIAAGVRSATMACPPSWYAVSLRDSALSCALRRSLPMSTLSRAQSSRDESMRSLPWTAARMAATFTRLACAGGEQGDERKPGWWVTHELRAAEAARAACKRGNVHIWRRRLIAQIVSQDCPPPTHIWQRDMDGAVEAAGPR